MNDAAQVPMGRFQLREVKSLVADPQVLTLRFSPCGNYLVAGTYSGAIRRWNATTDAWTELPTITGLQGWTQAVAFSPQDVVLIAGSSWGQLSAWTIAGGASELKWSVPAAHRGWLRDADVRASEDLLATCGADKYVRVWSTSDGRLQRELLAENEDLYVVRFTPDGRHLVAGDRRGHVWQWNVEDGTLVRQFDASALYKLDRIQDVGGVRSVAFDKSGRRLAIGGMKPKNGATIQGIPTLLMFDWESGNLLQTYPLGQENDCDLMGIYLHEEDFLIAVTNGGPGQGKLIMQYLTDQTPFFAETKIANVQSLAVHPGGRRLAVSGTNAGSNGNGRLLDKDGNYLGNKSPIHVFELESSPNS